MLNSEQKLQNTVGHCDNRNSKKNIMLWYEEENSAMKRQLLANKMGNVWKFANL